MLAAHRAAAGHQRQQQPAAGAARLDIEQPDGAKLLHVQVNRPTLASWRARVVLPEGRYRFEASATAKGANGDPRAGAFLRVSGMQSPRTGPTDGEWTRHSVEFEIYEILQEVELLCEALDSHAYWQLSDEEYRSSGGVVGTGSDDGEAADFIVDAKPQLAGVLASTEVKALADRVGKFDFDAALKCLSGIASRLSLNLEGK